MVTPERDLEEEFLIDPRLVRGVAQSLTDTGGAKPDTKFHLSKFEERILEIKREGTASYEDVLTSVNETLEGIAEERSSSRLVIRETRQRLRQSAEEVWTAHQPVVKHE